MFDSVEKHNNNNHIRNAALIVQREYLLSSSVALRFDAQDNSIAGEWISYSFEGSARLFTEKHSFPFCPLE